MLQAIADSFRFGGAYRVKDFFEGMSFHEYPSYENWGFTEKEFDDELDRIDRLTNQLKISYIEIA